MGACLSYFCSKLCLAPEVVLPQVESCHDIPSLTAEQARELLASLDNARMLVQSYLHGAQLERPAARKKSWWGRHCWPDKRRFLYRFVTIITIFFQFMNLLILTIIDTLPKHDTQEKDFLMASATTMIIIQLINLVLIILASGRLLKQIYRHSVNGLFLAQSYCATILLFAGMYTLTYRLKKKSWRFVSEDIEADPVQVFVLYAKFLFYSISTATLCGSDNALPVDWYNCLFAGIQMLLSFCYFASILGSSIGLIHNIDQHAPQHLPEAVKAAITTPSTTATTTTATSTTTDPPSRQRERQRCLGQDDSMRAGHVHGFYQEDGGRFLPDPTSPTSASGGNDGRLSEVSINSSTSSFPQAGHLAPRPANDKGPVMRAQARPSDYVTLDMTSDPAGIQRFTAKGSSDGQWQRSPKSGTISVTTDATVHRGDWSNAPIDGNGEGDTVLLLA